MPVQIAALFVFGLLVTGVVFIGVVKAREFHEREVRRSGTR